MNGPRLPTPFGLSLSKRSCFFVRGGPRTARSELAADQEEGMGFDELSPNGVGCGGFRR